MVGAGVEEMLADAEPAMDFVSVIVPVYNDAERIRGCLRALAEQSYPRDDYEVIVVDNGSTDHTPDVVREYAVSLVVENEVPGSYAARNAGIAMAKGTILALTDSDCIPAPDWLERAVAQLTGPASPDMLGGRVELFFKDPECPTGVELYESLMAFPQQHYIRDRNFSVTANLFVRRRVFEKAGVFDQTLRSSGDLEWGARAHAHGFSIFYAEDVVVRHPARASFGELYSKLARVAGGKRDLSRQGGHALPKYQDLRSLVPPVKTTFRLLFDERLTGLANRLKVIAVLYFVRYAPYFEKLRLTLGGTPKR